VVSSLRDIGFCNVSSCRSIKSTESAEQPDESLPSARRRLGSTSNVQFPHIAIRENLIVTRQSDGQQNPGGATPARRKQTKIQLRTQTTFSSTVGSTYSRYNSRNLSFCSFPVAVCGSSSAKTTSSGFHHFATLPS
jgi:hypothetical protein